MSADAGLAEEFEQERRRLVSLSYRMLGSIADAEDAVQEVWFRLARQDSRAVDNLPGWLTTVTGRVCLDMLRSRKVKAEAAFDEQVPDFVITADEGGGPEESAVVADSVGLALLVVLETLRPDERLAFVLHDMFAVPFAEIGQIIRKTPDASKMLASRARRKVQGAPTSTDDRQRQREVVDAFIAAARDGDFERLLEVLDPDITWTTHTPKGEVVRLGRTEIVAGIESGRKQSPIAQRVLVNGQPGILARSRTGKPFSVMACTIVDGRMVDVVALVDPVRLAAMDLPEPPDGTPVR
ncbi:sigma-70 family RNA polymerase sigma factor [Janibacter cremeus]|uniref:sigma-70 family RNA polymerase sigma factor n=1 Tax=Janibacter cremeus TaxID=1285192 RepID=UPI0023F80DA8|nr:sigma-70 family RNA polymerase sigma factor [Janibacter cremeus]WEV78743.1 sigma-70 family RNA polymerase sigma factor [Janibacter cremeus]